MCFTFNIHTYCIKQGKGEESKEKIRRRIDGRVFDITGTPKRTTRRCDCPKSPVFASTSRKKTGLHMF